ncbi:hypothetical protein B0O80DRAFT_465329 [Mortierella sp. GBAus27b]|nr:hypothetical protein B0O80DRAFT_465329 [Mortierella sp. GBAus27b]
MLCLECRLEYYHRYPEPIEKVELKYEWQGNDITKTTAQWTYHLSDEDLDGIGYDERENPHGTDWPMRLYDRDDVQARALVVHGGWVGIRAYGSGVAKKRSAACKARDVTFKTCTMPPRPKKKVIVEQRPTEEESDDSHTEYARRPRSRRFFRRRYSRWWRSRW